MSPLLAYVSRKAGISPNLAQKVLYLAAEAEALEECKLLPSVDPRQLDFALFLEGNTSDYG